MNSLEGDVRIFSKTFDERAQAKGILQVKLCCYFVFTTLDGPGQSATIKCERPTLADVEPLISQVQLLRSKESSVSLRGDTSTLEEALASLLTRRKEVAELNQEALSESKSYEEIIRKLDAEVEGVRSLLSDRKGGSSSSPQSDDSSESNPQSDAGSASDHSASKTPELQEQRLPGLKSLLCSIEPSAPKLPQPLLVTSPAAMVVTPSVPMLQPPLKVSLPGAGSSTDQMAVAYGLEGLVGFNSEGYWSWNPQPQGPYFWPVGILNT
jgi:hypothetical protein